jgi:Ca2+-binding EF-hand superfamily protein
MRTTTIRWTLFSGLATLALSACSGAGGDPSPADVPEGTASAPLQAPPQGTDHHARRDPAKMIEHFDANHDGKLQVAELPERMQKFLGKADADKDGVLTVAELTAARDAFHAKFAGHRGDFGKKLDPAEMVKKFDQNGDGKLQVAELPERMQKFLGKADADNDGVLTVAELTAAREAFLKEHFARMDKSGDGALTADEVGERKWAFVSAADADGNGSVTLPEIEAALAAGKLHFPHHRGHMDRGNDAPAPAKS